MEARASLLGVTLTAASVSELLLLLLQAIIEQIPDLTSTPPSPPSTDTDETHTSKYGGPLNRPGAEVRALHWDGRDCIRDDIWLYDYHPHEQELDQMINEMGTQV